MLVDTSVWSLALRRDNPSQELPELGVLREAVKGADIIVTTGLILQELLQGFVGPKARDLIIGRFETLPTLMPDLQDHIAAADLRNKCRRAGVQLGTIDALIAQLCIRYDMILLTTDNDFHHAAKHIALSVWSNHGQA